MGPSASAGMNVRAPTSTMVPTNKPTNSGVWVGSVPGLAGTSFFFASAPAMARTGTMSQ